MTACIKQQTVLGLESIIVGTDQRLSRNVSCVMQTHQDQLFFEAVYSALAAIIHEALGSFKTRQQIDVEVCTHWLVISALCLNMQHSLCNSVSERPTFRSNVREAQLSFASCLLRASQLKHDEPNGRAKLCYTLHCR